MKIIHSISVSTVLFLLIFCASGCNNLKQRDDSKALADTDRYYSKLSAERGMNFAFLAMFDSAGVLLRPNHPPVEGNEAISKLLKSQNDSTYTLTWEPVFTKVAASGDMGYTYGTYKVVDKATDSLSEEGTYSTIWQKDAAGKWKAVLDTGNPGL